MNYSQVSRSIAPFIPMLTGIAAIFYAYFIFTDRAGVGFYMLIDFLVFIILMCNIMKAKNNTLFIAALVWLVCNYVFNVSKKSQIWTGFDGFALALLLNTMPQLHAM